MDNTEVGMKKIGCGKYETTKVEAAKLPDP